MGWYSQCSKQREDEKYRCQTKAIKISGVITGVNTRSNYLQVDVDSLNNWISLNIKETVFKKGFSKNYYFSVGDSLIKEANSIEFFVKNDKGMAIYILDCSE